MRIVWRSLRLAEKRRLISWSLRLAESRRLISWSLRLAESRRLICLLALLCTPLGAQSFSFFIHDNTGQTPDVSLPANYQFAATPEGNSSSIVIKAVNTGASSAEVVLVYVGATAGTAMATPDFVVSGIDADHIVAPGAAVFFKLNFTPSTSGLLAGYLQMAYFVPGTGNGGTEAIASLTGTGTAPQLLLTYDNGSGPTPLLPLRTSPLDFGSISASATASISFALTNSTSSAVATPAVSIQTGVYSSSAFVANTSALPGAIAPNSSATFLVTFAPGETGLSQATLVVGGNSYALQGAGIVVNDIDALGISYVDATGVRTLPQAATPISFGQLVPGTPGGTALRFTVTNPQTSFNPVTLSSLSVTGAAYRLSGVPTLPAAIQPNASITFTVTFTASVSGTFTGTLSIGSRVFNLTGLGVVSPVPSLSVQFSQSTLTSAEQINATVQAASPSTQDAIGQLTMQFVPAIANVADDPAVVFLATGGRSLSLDLARNAQTATYQTQTELPFQTGTTAGTLTFTLTFPNTPPLTQSFTITPALIHLSSAQAVRSDPNLVITLSGYDNTYSAGKMSFTFYDVKGNAMNSTPMVVDATSDFHQYFFSSHATGGSFALQAKFPVKGDVSQIGSVAIMLNNSAGQAGTKVTFQ